DSIKDKESKDGKTYYKVVIQTNQNYLEKDGKKFSIIPGMVASVDIVTGQKSILDFILKPILKTKNSALHER
ncbi:MAG: HlyD family type I secretion periplasmic adaptor subunit, partial [Campylobacterota bacterium]|nr:HlyD family type I secretion periplasmic adaptor subunit [Campylobacterota bacterium]